MKSYTKSGAALAAAAFSLALSGSFTAPVYADDSNQPVICGGVNACKGQSECHSYTNSCKGTNACKGQGWLKMTNAEKCRAAGGNVVGKA